MNNVMKKIAAVAMAFTLIGPGTTVIKTISPQADNTIVANAANYGARDYWNYTRPTEGWNYGRYVGQRAGGGIYWIQAMMNYYWNGNIVLDVDGQYGPKTEDAVKRFQKRYNEKWIYTYGGSRLAEDGIFGPNTYAAVKRMGYTAGK